MQRQLSSFDIHVIVTELQELIGCHIEKIYQLSRDEILIRIKNIQDKQKDSIYIRNGELICITQKQIETPTDPSNFAMTLRKYLLNGKITEITQHEFDRIIKFKIDKKEGNYTLIVEFFSNGNIILVDQDGKIILPLIRQTWAHRTLKGRETYIPPPAQTNPFDFTIERFTEVLQKSTADLVRTLAVNINLGGTIAEEICVLSCIDKKTKITELSNDDILRIFDVLKKFLTDFKEKNFEPVLVKKDGEIVDILPFGFESYNGFIFEKTSNFTRGLEVFIGAKKVEKKKEGKRGDRLVEKLKRQLVQQQESVKQFEKEIQLKKLEGDLIYLNYQQCESLLKEISQTLDLKEKNDEIIKINQKEIVKEFNPNENTLIVKLKNTKGETYEVSLDFRKTVSENAEKAYEDNKKIKNKLDGAKISITKTKELIKSAEKKQEIQKEKEKTSDKKEKIYWFEKYRWFISSAGNIVIGGRDAKTNDLIVKKYLKEDDRYAHADIHGAPSIIIKNKGIKDEKIQITEETLEEACIFAASFSKAWKQFAEAQAYWVSPEQVSKTAQSGEFVPKGGFIIRGKRNYYRCKLEVAVGEINLDDEKKIMSGPVSAVKKNSQKYVILVPGDTKRNVIAHRLAKAFNVSVDSVDRVLPPGDVTISGNVGVDL